MADNIASLGIEIESASVAAAESRLRAIEAMAKRAGVSIEEMQRRVAAASQGLTLFPPPRTPTALGETQKKVTDLIGGMSQLGRATLESSRATEKLTAGMTAAGQAAAKQAQGTALATQQNKVLAATSEQAAAQASLMASRFGVLGTTLAALGPIGLAAGAALGVVTLGLKSAADAALALGERAGTLRDLAETIEVTVEQLQALQIGAAQTGIGQERLGVQLERFSVSMAEIGQETGAAFEALSRLNPALARQVANAGSLAEAWDLVAEAMRDANNEERNLAARALFGRGGVGTTRLLALTEAAGGIEAYTRALRQADLITQEQADSWDRLTDAIGENMRIAQQNIVSTFAGPVLGTLNDVTRAIREMTEAFQAMDITTWTGQVNLAVEALSRMPGPLGAILGLLKQFVDLKPARVFGGLAAGGSPAGLPEQAGREPVTGAPAGLPDAAALDAKYKQLGQTVKETTEDTRAADLAWRLHLETLAATGELTEEQIRIVMRLEAVYGRDIPAALNSAEAAQMKFNMRMLEAREATDDAARRITFDLGNAFVDFATGATTAGDAFKRFAEGVLAAVAQMIIRITLLNQLERALKVTLGGLIPGIIPVPGAASGGVLGLDRFAMVGASPGVFADAPRFQSGGIVGGGVPAILHPGEGVFTPGQMAALGHGGGDQIVNVTIENRAGVGVRTEKSTGADGSLNLRVLLDQVKAEIADDVRRNRGPIPGAMESRFGVSAARGNQV